MDGIGGEGGRAIDLRLRALAAQLAAELGEEAYAALLARGEQIHLEQAAERPR